MNDMDIPTQHPSLNDLDRYDMYDAPPPPFGGVGDSSTTGGMPVRPKRKQVKNACSACQRACKRCDVGRPCERCIKYGMADSCRDSQRKERKKGIKRGPYKKRDGEFVVSCDRGQSTHDLSGMVSDHLQRMSPKRMSRVSSMSEVDLSAPNLIPIDVDPPTQTQAVPMQLPSVPSVRSDTQYSYSTPVMVSASLSHTHTPPLSLAGIQHQQYQPQQPHYNNSNTHSQASSSYQPSEDPYYSTRYDHPAHASVRPAPFRIDDACSQSSHHQDYSRHVQQPIQDYTRSPMLHYPSPERSPPRERQYSNAVYHDNSSGHSLVQPVHHDPSYQSQSESMAQDHESHDTRVIDPYYATHQQRPYSSDGHMHDVHQQPDHQQQQQPYFSGYNAYQQPSTSYGTSHSQQQQYGYAQNHVPQPQAIAQSQNDVGYSQHLNYSAGSSAMNAYPAQSHHQMENTATVQLPYASVRSPIKMAHRGSIDATVGMVAHTHHSHHPQHHHQHHSQHVGNVQIQSN
ncbi:unnamed protein product [Rhizoctonia solani]|uniref:Zn(2)-C6 fungal-type domain-containing protein n=1 Tax=Rhizoctonia solani TaxID=456999 RepID=A0A8H3DD74_9AGAM|nr:unnamed protein product [Rhizoctonia solani]